MDFVEKSLGLRVEKEKKGKRGKGKGKQESWLVTS